MIVRVLIGHVLDRLAELPDESVHCCVTSPPYYGLRDYGTEPQVWGGNRGCSHKWDATAVKRKGSTNGRSDLGSTIVSIDATKTLAPGLLNDPIGTRQYRTDNSEFCRRCGAWRGSLGLEPTPQAYADTLVAVFREVRRVLRSDGTLWLNIGDSYAGSWRNQGRKEGRGTQRSINGPMIQNFDGYPDRQLFRPGNPLKNGGASNRDGVGPVAGIKPKDLIGIPWMLAFALRADGWWLRRDIIWHKPNPMPESVTDRCTTAHEYVFMLAKSERYYYDAEAIKEAASNNSHGGGCYHEHRYVAQAHGLGAHKTAEVPALNGKRNRRSVWTITMEPFPEAHFATFPPALVEPCILAGCPKGGTVLDPFIGAGTTALVADRLGRDCIGIELSAGYAAMAERRIRDDAGMFAQIAAE